MTVSLATIVDNESWCIYSPLTSGWARHYG